MDVIEAAYDAVKAFLVRQTILNSSRNSVHSFRTSGCNSSQNECLRFVKTCQQTPQLRNYQAKVSKQHSQPMGNENRTKEADQLEHERWAIKSGELSTEDICQLLDPLLSGLQ
ncbi:hypothetical protein T09_3648, partial [Trichinella sp. T9]